MPNLYTRGSQGAGVRKLRRALAKALGTDAAPYPDLAKGDVLDADVEAAIRQWQSGVGLLADGVVGAHALRLLEVDAPAPLPLPLISNKVSQLFPGTKPANVSRYLPYVTAALAAWDVREVPLILAALAFIRVESEGFVPIAEAPSAHNAGGDEPMSVPPEAQTRPAMQGDQARFRPRGYVQLTGAESYAAASEFLGVDLVARPDLATSPEVAAALLAQLVTSRAPALRKALAKGDFQAARKAFDGAEHGVERFQGVFELAAKVWPAQVNLPGMAKADAGAGAGAQAAAGKATRSRRRGAAANAAAADGATIAAASRIAKRTVNTKTKKDAIDIRDRLYLPPPVSLQEAYPSDDQIKALLPRYSRAGLILDQGEEGACTGFGLASVINYLRWRKLGQPAELESVSPRMLYNLARRYDEYAGANYEGSSCRGAIKGWFNHGVCSWSEWPYDPERALSPRYGYAKAAAQTTLGVYCRIDTTLITDIQAAIQTTGAVYVSAITHDGWNAVPTLKRAPTGHATLPLIPYDGQAEDQGGHAFVLVGFNTQGFVLQNSWGTEWGMGGFAILSYEDWLAHAMDAWVVSLGVPGVVAGRSSTALLANACMAGSVDKSRWWSEATAYEHSIVLGNDGRVKRYLTEDEQTRTLLQQACVLPSRWFRERVPAGQKKRLLIYAHGGLNSESDAIDRARAMGRYFVGNDCYPLFLVWKTGVQESIGNIISDWWRGQPAGKGFFEKLLEKAIEKTDRLIEDTIGRKGAKPIWSEMKENAGLAFDPSRGGQLLVNALMQLRDNWGDELEIHLVGHSAGSILLGHLISGVAARAQARTTTVDQLLDSVHLYAPACTVQFANEHYAPHKALLQRTHIHLLSDQLELDDNTVGIYRKSLLYLVSNALESDLRTPILGLEKVFRAEGDHGQWDGTSSTADTLRAWRRTVAESGLAQRLNVLNQAKVTSVAAKAGKPAETVRAAHGSFDNDVDVVTRTLSSITGLAALKTPVEDLSGF